MKRATHGLIVLIAVLIALPLIPLPTGRSQSPGAAVLRLRVRVKLGDSNALRGVARKRFFLFHGSLEHNRALLDAIEHQPLVTRDCYYTKNGASPALLNWLKEGDCESLY
jgi:hypothetical protein